jgi:hypothetical protein
VKTCEYCGYIDSKPLSVSKQNTAQEEK